MSEASENKEVPNPKAKDEDVPESKLTPEEKKEKDKFVQKLRRFLYTCNENAYFISGDPISHKRLTVEDGFPSIADISQTKYKRTVLKVLEEVNTSDPCVSQRCTIFAVISMLLKMDQLSDIYRNEVYITAFKVIKSYEDLFMLVSFTCNKPDGKKVPSGMQKLIKKFYSSRRPLDLAKEVSLNKGYYGWRHKDLIKLSHWKTDDAVLDLVVQCILTGHKKCTEKEIVKTNKDAKKVVDHLTVSSEVLNSKDEKYIANNIAKLNLDIDTITGKLHKSPVIWQNLIPALPLKDLLRFLPWMHKVGLLGQNSTTLKLVSLKLKDESIIKKSNIQPTQVLIALRNFEKGGKPKDIHLIEYLKSVEEKKKEADPSYVPKKEIGTVEPIKGSPVSAALYKTLAVSFENIQGTKKHIFITIDTRKKMMDMPCLTSKNVSCLDAAAVLALGLLRADKKATIATFKNDTVNVISVEKNSNFAGLVKKLQETESGDYIFPGAPLTYALNNKIHVDTFITMGGVWDVTSVPLEKRATAAKVCDNYKEYNNKLSKHARMVYCFFGTHNVVCGHPFALDINGFDGNVGAVINAFIKNRFH